MIVYLQSCTARKNGRFFSVWEGILEIKKRIKNTCCNLSLMIRHLKGRFKQRANNIQGDKIKTHLKYMKN